MIIGVVTLGAWLAWPAACVREEATPFTPALDQLWERAKEVARMPGTRQPRPAFCFSATPMNDGPRRIMGGIDARRNAAAVMLTPEELQSFGSCVVVHEMLHALLGPHQEEAIRAVWKCASCESTDEDLCAKLAEGSP